MALSGQPTPADAAALRGQSDFLRAARLRIREALGKIPYIVSFGSFIDETSAQADLILPDHAPLECWLDSMPESGSSQAVASLAPPAVLPLHDTRAMPDVLLGLAHQLGGDVAKALPWPTYDAMLRAAFVPLRTRAGSIDAKTDDDFWDAAQTQGGWWSAPSTSPAALKRPRTSMRPCLGCAGICRCRRRFSLLFSALCLAVVWRWFAGASALAAGAARRAHLGNVVELGGDQSQDRRSPGHQARRPGRDRIAAGKRARSRNSFPWHRARHGGDAGRSRARKFQLASPAAAGPTRSRILAPLAEHETGSLAWAATRVKLVRAGGPEQAKLVLFAGGMSGFPHEEERR